MFSIFKSTDLGNGYSLVEPPAGLLPDIHKRTKLYADGDKITGDIYAAIFILACLHRDGEPVFCSIFKTLPIEYGLGERFTAEQLQGFAKSIRSAYSLMYDDEFKMVISEFLYQINRDTLEQWFEAVQENSYITKKKADELKNDSPPETTTGS